MAEIQQRIDVDVRSAMKAGDRVRVSTLRMLSSELKNRRIELGRDLTVEDEMEILTRAAKQRKESEDQYRAGARPELADREAVEAGIVREYLPEPIEAGELDRLIDAAVAETGATGPRDMGAVMGRLMPQVKGRAEGGEVSRRVRERLAGGAAPGA